MIKLSSLVVVTFRFPFYLQSKKNPLILKIHPRHNQVYEKPLKFLIPFALSIHMKIAGDPSCVRFPRLRILSAFDTPPPSPSHPSYRTIIVFFLCHPFVRCHLLPTRFLIEMPLNNYDSSLRTMSLSPSLVQIPDFV